MSSDYTYDPDAWNPVLAGAVAGAVAALMGSLLTLILRSPDEIIANSLTVTIVAIVLGALSGWLWRTIRVTERPIRTFAWTMVGGFVVAMMAISFGHLFVLDNLVSFGLPIAALIFLTLGFFIPVLSMATVPSWIGFVVILGALVMGVVLFGQGNVASGDLSLDDLETPSTTAAPPASTAPTDTSTNESSTTSTAPAVDISGEIAIPGDLASSYTVTSGKATYEVPEVLSGLSTVGVGESTGVTGTIEPGGTFEFTLDLLSFTSDQSRRDSRVVGWFQEFPKGTFSGSEFELPPTATVGESVTFTVDGFLTINDITLPSTWQVEARVETNGTLSILGETDIVLTDFDVPIVTGGFVTMEDSAHLEVLVSATPGA